MYKKNTNFFTQSQSVQKLPGCVAFVRMCAHLCGFLCVFGCVCVCEEKKGELVNCRQSFLVQVAIEAGERFFSSRARIVASVAEEVNKTANLVLS